MIQSEDTLSEQKEGYKNKLWGMKKFSKTNSTKNKVILKRHTKGNATPLVYNAHDPKYNFLKYWRIVRKWAITKYELSLSDLELLLFLYDEGIWKKSDFLQATEIHGWDKHRFQRFKKQDLIRVWRDGKGYKGYATLYELTPKSKRICKSIYLKLTQEEPIPTNKQNNPMFLAKNTGFAMNYYRKAIHLMNKKRETKRNEDGDYDI